ncbi:hypothetical protein V2J09_009344 [Rumex salicifolius]
MPRPDTEDGEGIRWRREKGFQIWSIRRKGSKIISAGRYLRVLMASIGIGIASTHSIFHSNVIKRSSIPRVSCVQWDPEGIFRSPPNTGHIARLEFKRRLEKDSDARDEFERQIREDKERRLALRESRVVPDTAPELIEYLLDTEAQEIEFEIARLRPRLNKEFFSQLKFELGQLRFAVSKTEEMEDRIFELEALQKALEEGTEAYDKMQADLIKAKDSLSKILSSKNMKETLLEMVEKNELNTALLTLLDENIVSAQQADQKQAAEFMEKLRGAVLKYITV